MTRNSLEDQVTGQIEDLSQTLSQSLIWLDVDAGVDDAQGVMLCLGTTHVNTLGISCCFGNVDVNQVGKNVARILHVCEQESIPYYIGASKNILGQPRETTDWHGEDGLGDTVHFEHSPQCPEPCVGSAAVKLIEAVNAHPKKVTVVATGPLTNIALACLLDPEFPSKCASLVVMGGAVKSEGNTTPSGEYNFVCDPEAAYICLNAFERVKLLPWELMLRHQLEWETVEKWISKPTLRSCFLNSILQKLIASEKGRGNKFIACDPIAVAAAIHPCLVTKSTHVHLTIELQGKLTRGQCVVDWHSLLNQPCNVELVDEIDLATFSEMMDRATN
eukprot:CAMPEP_0198198932 /NCGR_PEP_ID=MMETSP1445-20131203/2290_1 /TAXON_ID=36898 /ORGANISM="Pyramimonas sp., Strain CCMP2087" /LENGTH=331 /DNA_ID=CAMNT_0043868611 /DNA_START=183 /DNA_END=1178 /DNA_ORIENTATION=+